MGFKFLEQIETLRELIKNSVPTQDAKEVQLIKFVCYFNQQFSA